MPLLFAPILMSSVPIDKKQTLDFSKKNVSVVVPLECLRWLQVTGIPAAGVSRESLKEAVNACGTALYVDFSFGELEAWIRYFMTWCSSVLDLSSLRFCFMHPAGGHTTRYKFARSEYHY